MRTIPPLSIASDVPTSGAQTKFQALGRRRGRASLADPSIEAGKSPPARSNCPGSFSSTLDRSHSRSEREGIGRPPSARSSARPVAPPRWSENRRLEPFAAALDLPFLRAGVRLRARYLDDRARAAPDAGLARRSGGGALLFRMRLASALTCDELLADADGAVVGGALGERLAELAGRAEALLGPRAGTLPAQA